MMRLNKIFASVVAAMMIVVAAASASGANRAVVIGLGKQLDPAWSKINGDNDVRYVKAMLTRLRYTDIVALTNEQATKQGIVDALKALARRSRAGDNIYVHYSGHGQLITDLNGDEAERWTGRHANYDESWVPYDAYLTYCASDRGEKHLTDDEVALLLANIRNAVGKTGKITVVVDSCHSGDATCAAADVDDMEEPEVVRGVDRPFNVPIDPRNIDENASAAQPEQWMTISACRPYELSTEITKQRVGKLTYALYQLGNKVATVTAAELERLLTEFMKQHQGRLPQNPMVTGQR